MNHEKVGSARAANYDLLRAISCVSVVLIHVSAIYVGDNFRGLIGNREFLAASCLRVLCQMSVPCFVMLSGAFLLRRKENADVRMFYIKSAGKIGIPILVFSIMYVAFRYIENLLGRSFKEDWDFDIYAPLLDWLKGEPHGAMWYMYMIIPLYLITPFLVILKSSIARKNWNILAGIMMVYSILVAYTCSLSWILEFAQWIGYFMMGNVISESAGEEHGLKLFRHPMLCVVMSYTILFLYWLTHTYRTMRLSGPGFLSPVNVVASLILFGGFSNLKINGNRLISMISRHSFYIYLLHPFMCEALMQIFGRVLKWLPPVWLIPLYTLCMVAVCILVKSIIDHCINRMRSG